MSRGEDLTTPEWLLHAGRARQLRQAIPETIRELTQVVVDNPASCALLVSGMVVATQVAFNLVKPKTAGQAIALFIVLNVGLPKLGVAAIEKGWITFRARDADGQLVPLLIGKAGAGAAAAPAEA